MEMDKNNYTFEKKTRFITFGLMAIGLIAMVAGYSSDIHDPENMRFWANFLLNSYFFVGIAVAATFFIALQFVTESAWSVVLLRVFMAVSSYLPVGAIFVIIVLAAGHFLHAHHLYHWMDPSLYGKYLEDGITLNPHYDRIIDGKAAYFSVPFFWGRTLAYFLVWIMFQRGFIKRSLEQDVQGGTELHYKQMAKGAIFIVFFSYTSSACSWDWLMSLDVHWFSTMYGWYAFSGMFSSAMTTMTLLILFLKKKGYLERITDSHIHDMGKWVFATGFLWTYLYFCQFLLIWYANIPEEVIYFRDRLTTFEYKPLMWTVFFMNFLFPMILLMSRDTKKNFSYLVIVCSVLLVGQWLNVYMMIMPATVKGAHQFGFTEIGMALGFIGLFLYVINAALAKHPINVEKSPYLEESMNHHT
jgi:hypothetical protein